MTRRPGNGLVPDRAHGESTAPIDFSALSSFDVEKVRIVTMSLEGVVAAPAGRDPRAAHIGECCGNYSCPYPSIELSLFPSVEALALAYLRDTGIEWSGVSARTVLQNLSVDVWQLSSAPLEFADLREHPITDRVQMAMRLLRERPKESLQWELIRLIKDHHTPAGVLLPIRPEERGLDIAFHRDFEQHLCFEPLGALYDALPPSRGTSANRPAPTVFSMFGAWARHLRRLGSGS